MADDQLQKLAETLMKTGMAASTYEAIEKAKSADKVVSYLEGKEIKKAIYVPGRLVSLVVA